MSERITLHIGEKLYYEDVAVAGYIVKGTVDVYATNMDRSRRMFFTTRTVGDEIYSFCDDFKMAELFVLAKEETTILLFTKEDVERFFSSSHNEQQAAFESKVRSNMKKWFQSFLTLEWIHFFVARGDEYVAQWPTCEFIDKASSEELWPLFVEHQNILAMLTSGQFAGLKGYVNRRLDVRQEKKLQMMDASVKMLTSRAFRARPEAEVGNTDVEIVKLVNVAMHFYNIEKVNLDIPNYIKKNIKGLELLKYVLGRAGFRSRQILLEQDWYTSDAGVIFVEYDGQWCLALPSSSSSYDLVLPKGDKKPFIAQDMEKLRPEAYIVYPALPNHKLTPKEFLKIAAKMCWKRDYFDLILVSIVIGLIPILTPMITKTVFSDVIPTHDYQSLSTITQVLFVAACTTALLTIVRNVATYRIANHINMDLTSMLFSRLLALPIEFFKKYSVGELFNRFMSVEAVIGVINTSIVESLCNFLFSFWSLIMMCYYSWKLAAVAVGCLLVYMLLCGRIYKKLQSLQREAVKAENAKSSKTVQIFSGLARFRSSGNEEQAFYMWTQQFFKCQDFSSKINIRTRIISIINIVVPILTLMALYYMTSYNMEEIAKSGKQEDLLQVADFMAFFSAYSSFSGAVIGLVGTISTLLTVKPNMENMAPILEEETEVSDDRREADKLVGEIRLEHVSFSYGDGPDIIKDLSLHIMPGEKVAFVGPSGCGKSTLMNIILGFEKPKTGTVSYDGYDISTLNAKSVRRQMGVVLQNGKLLAGSILDNIIGGNNLTIDDAWDAARKVAFDKDIEDMPMGMHTVINDGSTTISGGQRQRLLLARSIVHKPVILLLDEATSALDNTTQAIVTESLEKMKCTQLIVAHRLSTIENADRIIVLKDGGIFEEGSFKELMEKDGLFAQMAKRQIA